MLDNGIPCGAEANMAKWLAADAGFQAADQAMQPTAVSAMLRSIMSSVIGEKLD